jgi:copper transport protein
MTPTTPRRRLAAARAVRAALLLAAAAFATLLLTATPAAAHATLTGSSPSDGEVVTTAPREVTLTFSEQVALADDAIRVLDPGGDPAHTGRPTDASTDGAVRHAISLRDDLPDGTYTVAWHVVSADSHPISGAFTFSIGAPSATTVDPADQISGDGGGTVGLGYDIARYAAYAGFLLLAGGGAFILRCWPGAAALPTAHRVLAAGWTIVTAATLAQLLLRTPYTGSGRLADAFDLGGLQDVIDTRAGTALLTRLLLLAAAAAFIAVLTGPHVRATGRDRQRDLRFGLVTAGIILATGTAATWSMAEHASTGPQTGLAIPADTLHLLAVAAWLGGLATLLALLHREPAALPRDAVRRYSQLALGSVIALAATGLYQSWRQVRTLSALTGTDYGRLLILKLALIATMLCVAFFSRRLTARLGDVTAPEPTPEPVPVPVADTAQDTDPERARQLARQRAAVRQASRVKTRDADPHRRGLRRSVLAEAGVAAVVLAVTTALTATTPARTEAGAGAEPSGSGAPATIHPPGHEWFTGALPYDTGGEYGRGTAQLDLSPARAGDNTLHIRLIDRQGQPNGAVELRVALTLPAEDIGPLRFDEPDHVDVGHWTLPGVRLPRPGEWRLDLTIRTSDIDQTTVSTTISIS